MDGRPSLSGSTGVSSVSTCSVFGHASGLAFLVLASLLLLTSACNQREATPGLKWSDSFQDGGTFSLKKVATVGKNTGPLIGAPASVSVDERGQVYVADQEQSIVWSLSPQGDSLGAIGRKGRGPGEFLMPTSLTIGPNDSLFVLDFRSRRISVFTPGPERSFAYSFHGSSSRARNPNKVFPTPTGTLFARYTRPEGPNFDRSGHWLTQINRRGEILKDELFYSPLRDVHSKGEGNYVVVPPFGRKPVFAYDNPTGRVCHGWTDSLHVQCYLPNGANTTVLDVEYIPREVTEEDIQNASETYDGKSLALIKDAGWHETLPAFGGMTIDRSGRFWIRESRRTGSTESPLSWRVVDTEKKTVRTTTLTSSKFNEKIQAATREYVYVTAYGVSPYVWVYRIVGMK